MCKVFGLRCDKSVMAKERNMAVMAHSLYPSYILLGLAGLVVVVVLCVLVVMVIKDWRNNKR